MSNLGNHGWVCPKCGAVMGPLMPTCCYCKPVEYYVSGGTVPKQNPQIDRRAMPVREQESTPNDSCLHKNNAAYQVWASADSRPPADY